MTALETLQATLQDARTEAATLRIELAALRMTAQEALGFVERIIEYGHCVSDEDQATDVVGRIEDDARELAKRLGYDGNEWTALRAPTGRPEQDRGAAAIRPAGHPFLLTPFYPDRCDAKVDEDGRIRTCGRPREEHA